MTIDKMKNTRTTRAPAVESSRAGWDSLLRTWTEFHVARLGEATPVLPLTVDKVRKVSALFKEGGYRGFANYATRIKDHHVEGGTSCPRPGLP